MGFSLQNIHKTKGTEGGWDVSITIITNGWDLLKPPITKIWRSKIKDGDRLFRVKLKTHSPDYYQLVLENKILLFVPKGVEINTKILTNSGYFDDWWETGVIEGQPYPNINWERTDTEISFYEVENFSCRERNHHN